MKRLREGDAHLQQLAGESMTMQKVENKTIEYRLLRLMIISCVVFSILIAGYLIGVDVQNNHQFEYYNPDNRGYDFSYILLRFGLALIFPGLPLSMVLTAVLVSLFYIIILHTKNY